MSNLELLGRVLAHRHYIILLLQMTSWNFLNFYVTDVRRRFHDFMTSSFFEKSNNSPFRDFCRYTF